MALNGLSGMIGSYLATPDGQKAVRSFLCSPEGQATIDSYLATSQGQEMAQVLLLRSLDRLAIPDEAKASIREALLQQEHPPTVCDPGR